MKYSIIIPAYNAENYLSQTIESVLAQCDISEYELILVDDGSKDETGKICDKFAAKFENIHAIHTKNGGVSAARNCGLSHAQGEYILFLDADDLWHENLLNEVNTLTLDMPDMILFNHYIMSHDESEIIMAKPALPAKGESGIEYMQKLFSLSQYPKPYVWCYVYKREFLLENGLVFKHLVPTEDFQFNMECLQLAKSIVNTEKSLHYYRQHSESLTRHYSEDRFLTCLEVKAYWYRQFPVGALADLYLSQVLLLALLKEDADFENLLSFIKANKDIIFAASHRNFVLAKLFFAMLGYKRGAKLYCQIRNLVQSHRK